MILKKRWFLKNNRKPKKYQKKKPKQHLHTFCKNI